MSELISGKEALIALTNGEEVEYETNEDNNWLDAFNLSASSILNSYDGYEESYNFRLKSQTITINNIQTPIPKKIQTTGGNVVSILCENSGDAVILSEALQRIFSEQPQ